MSFVVIPAKVDSTVIPITVDFISQLVSGEAVMSAAVTVSVFTGVDANADAILSGSPSIVTNSITQTFTGGVAGVVYLLNYSAGTNYGNSISIQAYLAVITSTPFN